MLKGNLAIFFFVVISFFLFYCKNPSFTKHIGINLPYYCGY